MAAAAFLSSGCTSIIPNTAKQIEATPEEVWISLWRLGEALVLDVALNVERLIDLFL